MWLMEEVDFVEKSRDAGWFWYQIRGVIGLGFCRMC